jgi:hypothetical protein
MRQKTRRALPMDFIDDLCIVTALAFHGKEVRGTLSATSLSAYAGTGHIYRVAARFSLLPRYRLSRGHHRADFGFLRHDDPSQDVGDHAR